MNLNGREQSRPEEVANALTHGLGLLASMAALPVLVAIATGRGDVQSLVGAIVFGSATLILYAMSTIYHALPPCRGKRVFQVLDHSAIYVMIASTYTPFTLGALRGVWGWSLFGVVWGLAVLGVLFEALGHTRYQRLSTAVYIVKGWLIVVALRPMLELVPTPGLLWLLCGGLLYTGGVWFYAHDHRRYHHAVWHLFVLGGTVCHYVAVLWYAG